MYNPYIPEIIKLASRDLRKNMTYSEKQLWEKIKNNKIGYKFMRQRPVYSYTEESGHDRYIIPDFICLKLKLIIEIDWNIHDIKEIYNLDREKELFLENKWFKIIRFKNKDINDNIDNVIRKIVALFP